MPPKDPEPIVFEPLVIKARPEVAALSKAPLGLTGAERERLLRLAAQQMLESQQAQLKTAAPLPQASQAGFFENLGPNLLSLAEGAGSGAIEAATEYARTLVPGAQAFDMFGQYAPEYRSTTPEPSETKTPGKEFKETVIKKRLEMPFGKRVAAPITDIINMFPVLWDTFTEGTPEQQQQMARDIGRSLTYGTAGQIEQLAVDPFTTVAAQPTEAALAALSASRSLGALAKSARGKSKAAKATRAAGEVLDPEPQIKVKESFQRDAVRTMTPEQAEQYQRLYKIDPKAAKEYREKTFGTRAQARVEVARDPSVYSRAGQALKREGLGGLLAAGTIGDPVAALLTSFGLAVTPEAIRALKGTLKKYGVTGDKLKSVVTAIRRETVAAEELGDPVATAQAQQVLESGRSARGVEAQSYAAAASAEKAGSQAIEPIPTAKPLRAKEQTLEFREGRLTEPPETIETRQKIIQREQEARAMGPSAKIAEETLRAKAKDVADAASGGDPKKADLLYRAASAYNVMLQNAAMNSQKVGEKLASLRKFEAANPKVAEAFRVARLKNEAIKNLKQAAVMPKGTKRFYNTLNKQPENIRNVLALYEYTKDFKSRFFKPFQQHADLDMSAAYAAAKKALSKKELKQVAKLEQGLDNLNKAVTKKLGKEAEIIVSESIDRLIDLKQKKTALSKKAKRLRADADPAALAKLQKVHAQLRALTKEEIKYKGKLAKKKIALETDAPGLIDIVANMRSETALRKNVLKVLEKVPKSEKALRKLAKQDKPVEMGLKSPMSDAGLIAIATTDPEIKYLHKFISNIYSLIRPDHRLADPNYLNQLVANAHSRNALVGAFSARVRGAVSKNLYAKLKETNPEGLKSFVAQLKKESPSFLPAKARNDERIFRAAIEKMIIDRMSKPIASGAATELRFVIPTGEGNPPIVISPAQMAGELYNAAALNKDYKGILSESLRGLHSTVAKNLQVDLVQAKLAEEAARGASPIATVAADTNAFHTLKILKEGEDLPNILMFNPSEMLKQVSKGAPQLQKTLAKYGLTYAEAVDALKDLSAKFQEASPEVAGAIRAGLRNYKANPRYQNHPLYVYKGYNSSIGTHLRLINNVADAEDLGSKVSAAVGAGTAHYLVGSGSSIKNNALANITLISTATGTNPATVFSKSVDMYVKLLAEQRGGKLDVPGMPKVNLTPYERRKIRAMQAEDVVNAALLGQESERLFKARDPSQGRIRSGWRAYWNIRKDLYKAVDAAPKMYLASLAYDTMHRMLKMLPPGRYFGMPMGKGRYLYVTRNADGKFLWGNNKVPVDLDTDIGATVLMRSAKQFGNDVLFDMADMPNWVKRVLSSKGGLALSTLNRYLSWQIKAAELPGVKQGLFSKMLGYDPMNHIVTDAPNLLRMKSAAHAKLIAKRFALQRAASATSEPYNYPNLSEDQGWNAAADFAAWSPIGDVTGLFGRTMDQTQANSGVVMEQALNMLTAGGAAVWDQFGYSTEQMKRDATSKDELDRMRFRLYRDFKSGELANRATALDYFAFTGGLFSRVLQDADKEDQRAAGRTALFFLRMFGGNDFAAAADIIGGQMQELVPYSTRRILKPKSGQPRLEDFYGWAFSKALAFGFREKNLEQSGWAKHRVSEVKRAFLGGFKAQKALLKEKYKAAKDANDQQQMQELKQKFERLLENFADAEKRFRIISNSFKERFRKSRAKYFEQRKRFANLPKK